MNVKNIGLLFLTVLTLFACDDTTNTLGIGMLPPSDTLSVHTKVYNVTTESYLADAVYAKTSTGYVGRFTDPKFGYYESSFLTELNCSENFTFPEVYKYNEATKTGTGTMAGDTVTAIQLVVYYNSWFGDSLNACRISVYELDQKLDEIGLGLVVDGAGRGVVLDRDKNYDKVKRGYDAMVDGTGTQYT